MPLTEIQAKKCKPRKQAYKLADGKGLFLPVQPNGSRLWRMKCRISGKEKLLCTGTDDRSRQKPHVFGREHLCQALPQGVDLNVGSNYAANVR